MGSDRIRRPGFHNALVRAGLRLGPLVLRGGALWFAPASVAVAQAQRSAAVAASVVFDGVTVVDVDHGGLVPDQRVVITGNRIRAMGDVKAVKVPGGAQVVDARGKYLIPGLWDMHVHAGRSTELFYPLLLANGVTGIRDAGSPVPLDTLIQWRREILAGLRIGPPRQILSGPAITDLEDHCDRREWQARNDLQTCVADSADARRFVDSLKAAGADMIKPRAVTPATYFVIAAEARRLGIPFGGHAGPGGWTERAQGPETAIQASDSGARIVDHAHGDVTEDCLEDHAAVERCRPLAERLRRNGTWVVLDRFHGEQFGFAERMQEFWSGSTLPAKWLDTAGASPTDSMHIAQRVGLPMAAGTDVSGKMAGSEWSDQQPKAPGFILHGLLAKYVVDGLTPLTALQTATLNPAKLLHATDSLGTVAPGKLADLVLLDANPLADITNTTTIRAVVADGRYYDRAALDQLLAEVQAKAKAMLQSKPEP